ncbi:MAG: LysR family transcriptional regulator [Sedimentitalea sp.]
MSDTYRGLAVFVAVAEAGSFSAAGRRLKLSTSVVSHHVSKLEARLDVPLFFRSTRSLSLTSEGRQILGSARRMVAAADEALDALSDHGSQPVGALRITLPAFGTSSPVHQAVWRFAHTYPMVALSVHSNDRPVDLVAQGYDLAIRLGTLTDSALKNRRIGVFHRKLVAAPKYLDRHPPIETLDALMASDFLALAMLRTSFTISRGGEDVTVAPHNIRLELDSVTTCKAATVAGLGVAHLPLDEIEPELQTGKLVEVLPDWSLPSFGIYAVWPDSGPQKKLTRRLIDFLADYSEPG